MPEQTFFEQVYAVCREIPEGRITTYGAVANALGSKGARMVGYAMNGSHAVSPKVPAHRVVNRKGLLSGRHHFATPTRMQELLEAEGIEVVDDQIQHFDELFWNPIDELEL